MKIIVQYEELYKAYLDCRLRKRSTINSIEFEMDENVLLYRLWKEVNNGTYEIGKSIAFFGFLKNRKTFNLRLKVVHSKYFKKWMKYCYYNSTADKLTIFKDYLKYNNNKNKKRLSYVEYITNDIENYLEYMFLN